MEIMIRIRKLTVGVSIILFFVSCTSKTPTNIVAYSYNNPISLLPPDSIRKWQDWNVLFKPSSTFAERILYMNNLVDSLHAFVIKLDTDSGWSDSIDVKYIFCPCDSTLFNLIANTSILAAGTLASTPTKPPNPGSSGDPYLYVLKNNEMKDRRGFSYVDTPSNPLNNYFVDSSKILAVMDTGLDSTLFKNKFHDLLWRDVDNQPTLRNFVWYSNSQNLSYYFDDESSKHGSAVTSVALEALKKYSKKNNKLPKVMVLKVLDSAGLGSIFSVSCALHYATQKKATVVNASLGYLSTGGIDSILHLYVDLCVNTNKSPIPLIAAAGNLDEPHTPPLNSPVDITSPNNNKLDNNNLFFPGCFSVEFKNVICVSGLQSATMPCSYQKYSPEYVSIGVITNPSPIPSKYCCSIAVNFFNLSKRGYEGSSFETPVVTGKLLSTLMLNSGISLNSALNTIGSAAAVGTLPVAKKVITYISTP